MATKGKDPIIHAEAQVSAMQDILKRWIDANPSNAELQAFKNMKPGQWDNRTNEVFTRWVIATQTAHNTAHPNDKIKVDGWAGDQTLRALGSDPKAAEALKNLQNAGLDRFHHRTDAHPPKGQEVNPDIAAKLPPTSDVSPSSPGGANPNATPTPAPKSEDVDVARTPTGPGGSDQPTTPPTPSGQSSGPSVAGQAAAALALATPAAIMAKRAFAPAASAQPAASTAAATGARSTVAAEAAAAAKSPIIRPMTTAEIPPLTAPRIRNYSPVTGAAATEIAAAGGDSAAPKAPKLELVPKESGPVPGGKVTGAAAAATEEASLLSKAWGSAAKLGTRLGVAALVLEPTVAAASTEGTLEDRALAGAKSMLTVDYALGAAAVLGSAPVSVPALATMGLKAAWEQGLEDNKAKAEELKQATAKQTNEQEAAIGQIQKEYSGFTTEFAIMNGNKPYTGDADAVAALRDEKFFDSVYKHYETKAKADTAAGRSEEARNTQQVLAGLGRFRAAESDRQEIVYQHMDPVAQAADSKHQALPVFLP